METNWTIQNGFIKSCSSQLRLRRTNGNFMVKAPLAFVIDCSQLRLRRTNGNLMQSIIDFFLRYSSQLRLRRTNGNFPCF